MLLGVLFATNLLCGTALAEHAAWRDRYDAARQALVDGRDQEAAAEFEDLVQSAPTSEDRKVAEEFAAVARERAGNKRREPLQPKIRTTDELSILYTTAFLYGFGTSGWLTLQIKPQSFPAAVLPFLALTTASVGGVAIADRYRPLRLGVPQAISTGLYLGVGEGIWLTGYQHSQATRTGDSEEGQWRAETVATLLWTGGTVGAATGALVGGYFQPTPGQTSFTASAALWGGVFTGLVSPVFVADSERASETAFITGLVGYNLGMAAGAYWAGEVSPSIARVRFVDLGGLAGGLVGAGAYLLAVGDDAEARGGLLASGIGLGAGLSLSWWATAGMDQASSKTPTALESIRPIAAPLRGGWMFGVSGAL
jgi:hypothetical protein